ncbi:hypothetical protein [Piscirickettsia salmonis]|uniref:hypothetical protein n=1 Tax=Piscirickettsia salmonis TaxID=1238 RepID=UPI0012FF41E9
MFRHFLVLSQFEIFTERHFSSGIVRLRASKIAGKLLYLDGSASVAASQGVQSTG